MRALNVTLHIMVFYVPECSPHVICNLCMLENPCVCKAVHCVHIYVHMCSYLCEYDEEKVKIKSRQLTNLI